MTKKESIGERIRRFRKRKKITQKEMGDYLGVKNNTISTWENDVNSPDVNYIGKICKLLEITPSEMLGYTQEEIDETVFKKELSKIDPRKIIPRYYSLPEYAQDTVDRTIDNYNDILIAASGAENLTDEELKHNMELGEYYYNLAHKNKKE